MTDAARSALTVSEAFSALGNERFQADGATFVRNREIADIWDANHVAHITAATPDEIDGLLARVEREFAGFRHRQYRVDFTTPPAFEARLALEGFERDETLVMLLEGELSGTAKPCEIRTVESEADWNAYTALHDIDWREYRERMPGGPGGFDEGTAAQMMRSRRSMSPPVRHWLACVDGEPRAYLSSWGGVDGVGLVEDLFTHPDFRHRGLATALIHHGVSEARREGAGPIVIVADTKDTPKRMYAALGFAPVALKRDYLKRLGS
ncbi:MAG: GNAT family N-acetyltransferase [Chloroflexi bacterium]|nr:GNAT family N-acetyltransferase [Chloroflexota bacterium]